MCRARDANSSVFISSIKNMRQESSEKGRRNDTTTRIEAIAVLVQPYSVQEWSHDPGESEVSASKSLLSRLVLFREARARGRFPVHDPGGLPSLAACATPTAPAVPHKQPALLPGRGCVYVCTEPGGGASSQR